MCPNCKTINKLNYLCVIRLCVSPTVLAWISECHLMQLYEAFLVATAATAVVNVVDVRDVPETIQNSDPAGYCNIQWHPDCQVLQHLVPPKSGKYCQIADLAITVIDWLIDWLIDWCFNGTSTQKGQFVPTAGERNRRSQLRMANEIQCIIPYVTR